MSKIIPASTFDFLRRLGNNNNRNWFDDHKPEYQQEQTSLKSFVSEVVNQMNKFDQIESSKVYRIYRDIRFSKDKTPYNKHFSFSMVRATKFRRGGYYCRIEPGGASFVGGGFWGPNKDDLLRIRTEIAADDQPLRAILANEGLKSTFGNLQGDQLKTAPKGFAKDHPAIDLLRYKQFLLLRPFEDHEVLDATFFDQIIASYQAMMPFFDYMSEVLTTNANGELVV